MNDLLYPILALAAFVCWRKREDLNLLELQWPLIFYGVFFYLLGECGDLISTVVGMNHGLVESNTLMSDPLTRQFLLGNGLAVKFLVNLLEIALPSRLLFLATRRLNPYVCCILSSALFWWRGYELIQVTVSNLLHLFF